MASRRHKFFAIANGRISQPLHNLQFIDQLTVFCFFSLFYF
ncbi:hypothetical protein [Gloeocapsa sp. PCC 7428]